MDSRPALAEPLAQIFRDRSEAEWAFDFLRDTVKRLGISGPYDPRLALTLTYRAGKLCLHLNFGRWLVVGFGGPDLDSHRVELTLLFEPAAWEERLAGFPFTRKESRPEVRTYVLPWGMVRPLSGELRAAYLATVDFIATRFQNWKRSPYWKGHNPEIVEALFDPERRARLFSGDFAEKELRYERHLTAFYQDVSEEEEGYMVNFQLPHNLLQNLSAAFAQFQQDPNARLGVKLRRKRAEQLQALLSNPEAVDLATFNREVWVFQSGAYLRGEDVRSVISQYDREGLTLEQVTEMEQALESGELELHGNWTWGTGSGVYAPRLKDDLQKIENIRQALSILNDSSLSPLQKAEEIRNVYGFGLNITTGLVMVFHPTEFNIDNKQGRDILKKLGYETVSSLSDYQEIMHLFKEQLKAEDFLELDLFLWLINQGKYGGAALPQQIEADQAAGGGEVQESAVERDTTPPLMLSELAEATGFDQAELARWVRAVERKKQIVLYGPPGTGKTYLAEKLAQHLVGGGDGFWELVQFHPAYAYEDFIQGIRPHSEGDSLSYPLVPGRFLEFCREAGTRRDPCVLVIDEINRANLARVFGELMYLLEYRHREAPLAGGGLFRIPDNVYLIGTMNTADRSIALVDHALRRRFAFIVLPPNYEVLRRFHHRRQTGFPVEALIEILERLNRAIGDPHYALGITFFLHEELAEQLEDIWRMEIEPYLEEYFFDQPEKVADFRWPRIAAQIAL